MKRSVGSSGSAACLPVCLLLNLHRGSRPARVDGGKGDCAGEAVGEGGEGLARVEHREVGHTYAAAPGEVALLALRSKKRGAV